MPKKKPHGKHEVMAAVLDAAAKLFAERGVAAVSIRDIAAQAGVNHGLIFRHFGSKQKLRLAVQEKLAADVRQTIGEPAEYTEGLLRGIQALRKHEDFWRVLARTLLDGDFTGDVQTQFPYLRRQVELIRDAQDQGRLSKKLDPRLITAGGVALALGLLVFEDYIVQGAGLSGDNDEDLRMQIQTAWLDFLVGYGKKG